MLILLRVVPFAVAVVTIAPGQTVTRTLRFAHLSEASALTEAATVIRSTTEIRDARVDAPSRTFALQASAAQIELAEWLLRHLDQSPTAQHPEVQAFQALGLPDPEVRIFHASRVGSIQTLQELATTIRSIGQIRRAFTFNPSRSIVMRGTADELALAEWLFTELHRDADTRTASDEYRLHGESDEVLRVFYPVQARTPEELQAIAVEIRKALAIRHMFPYQALRAITVRGTRDQLTNAEKMLLRPQ